jgi:hypothetical protein
VDSLESELARGAFSPRSLRFSRRLWSLGRFFLSEDDREDGCGDLSSWVRRRGDLDLDLGRSLPSW